MKKLYKLTKKYSLVKAINIENNDRQFIALNRLYHNIWNKEIFLALIISNSIICYQLSSKWEDYWEEFSEKSIIFFSNSKSKNKKNFFEEIFNFFDDFLVNSKWNKRFIKTKLKRLKKLETFFDDFLWKQESFYNNMEILRDKLAITMKQKKDAKTIVFAVKMFSYWARIYFDYIKHFPQEIMIPIDSRLIKMYEKYKEDYNDVNLFYNDLSKKLKIAPLHLDAILWVNYEEIMKVD